MKILNVMEYLITVVTCQPGLLSQMANPCAHVILGL